MVEVTLDMELVWVVVAVCGNKEYFPKPFA